MPGSGLETLEKFAEVVSREVDESSVYSKALSFLNQDLGYKRIFLYLISQNRFYLQGQVGFREIPFELPLSHGALFSVLQSRKPVSIKNTQCDFISHQEVQGALICVPLLQEEEAFGILGVESLKPEELNEVELLQLELIGIFLSLTLGKLRLLAERDRALQELKGLSEVAPKIASFEDLNTLLKEIVEEACRIADADKGGLYLKEAERDELRLAVVRGFPESLIGYKLPLEKGLSEKVSLSSEPLLVSNYSTWEEADPTFSSFSMNHALSIPLKSPQGVIGAFFVGRVRSPAPFSEDQVRAVSFLAEHASVAIEKAKLQDILARRINELEKAQKSLEKGLLNYRLLFEESPIPLWIEDLSSVMAHLEELQNKGAVDLRDYLSRHREEVDKLISMVRVESVNRATLEFLKIKSQAEIGEGLSLVISEEARRTFIDVIVSAFEEKKIFEAETINRIATGEDKHILLKSVLLPEDEEGRKRILVALIDLTEQIRAEEALKLASLHWAQFIEASPDPMWMKDASGRYIACNKAWLKLVNRKEEDVIGKTDWELYPPDVARSHIESDQIAVSNGIFEGEFKQATPKGELIFLVRKVPLRSPEGKIVGNLGLGRDITERKRAEEEMENARRNFILAVSHEMKTPLMNIMTARELLKGIPDEEQKKRFFEYDQIWEGNILRLKRLVDNLIDSQRSLIMGMKLLKVPVDLRKLVESVLEDLGPLTQYYSVSIESDLKPVPEMSLDREAIERMIDNLLSNAIKFSPKEGKVRVSLWHESDLVFLSVEDQGKGISPEEVLHLFQPFSRGREAIKEVIPGTGLGLYVSKLIAEAHGGEISLESSPGKGTRVTVRLPLSHPSSE